MFHGDGNGKHAPESWFVMPVKWYSISTGIFKSHLIEHTKSGNGWERLVPPYPLEYTVSRHVADARAGS